MIKSGNSIVDFTLLHAARAAVYTVSYSGRQFRGRNPNSYYGNYYIVDRLGVQPKLYIPGDVNPQMIVLDFFVFWAYWAVKAVLKMSTILLK